MIDERVLQLTADAEAARRVAAAVRAMLAGRDELVVHACELAVTEACANVIEHAYAGSAGPLRVVLRVRHGRFSAAICDQGAPFVPPPAGASLPEPTAEGGRGLMLLTLCMDRLGWRRVGDENRLLMARALVAA